MIGKTKKLNSFQKIFINTNEKIQFAVEVNDPKYVPIIIKNLKSSITAFNLRKEEDHFVYDERPIHIYEIPKSIKSSQEACSFISKIDFDYKDRFAIIAANDNHIAINVSHLICDGGFFVDLFGKLLKQEPVRLKSVFPITTEEVFPNECNKVDEKTILRHKKSFEYLTSLRWSPGYEESLKKVDDKTTAKFVPIIVKVKDAMFWKNKFGLTETYWIGLTLSMMAMNGKLDEAFGVSTCVDLRNKMSQESKNPSISQNFSSANIIAKGVSPNITVRDLGKLMREDLQLKQNDGTLFASYKSLFITGQYESNLQPFGYAELSNIGRFPCTGPIVDMWVQNSIKSSNVLSSTTLIAFSKDYHGENTIVAGFQQPIGTISEEDTKVITKSIEHFMTKMPVDITLQEAFNELKHFQHYQRSH